PRPPGGGGRLKVHAFASLATLPTLISVRGEKRVPARSWSYVRHSCAGVAAGRCARPATASPRISSAAVKPHSEAGSERRVVASRTGRPETLTTSVARTLYIDSARSSSE